MKMHVINYFVENSHMTKKKKKRKANKAKPQVFIEWFARVLLGQK